MTKNDKRSIEILSMDIKDSLGKNNDYEAAVKMVLARLESWGDFKYDVNVQDLYQELQYYKFKESGR